MLIIGGVSVVAIGLLAVGADAVMKQMLIYGLCENFDVRIRGVILLGLVTSPCFRNSVRSYHGCSRFGILFRVSNFFRAATTNT